MMDMGARQQPAKIGGYPVVKEVMVDQRLVGLIVGSQGS